ncbi:MAG TPA: protoporphyrinogen oxidase [Deltaproteobacteria bacterium]|nr:protoporphyrinogen oxidase [Deltaproteobacteria bacterium]
MKRVVIVGGGVSGLVTAYRIEEAAKREGLEVKVTLLERRDRPGGNIRTERVDGYLIEAGPDCFLSEKPWALALCRETGLGDELLATNEEHRKTYVLSGGRLHELPEGVILMVPTRIVPLLASSLISLRGKLRMAMEPFVPRRKGEADESLGDFVRRRLGREVLEKIAEPLVAGVHAGDPETMSIKSSFPKFVELEERYGSLIIGMLSRIRKMREMKRREGGGGGRGERVTMFMTLRSGLSTLVDRLLELTPSAEVRTGAVAAALRRTARGYEVGLEGGERVEADAVVIAAPAYAAARLVEELDGELAARLLSIPYVSTATVSLGYRRGDVAHPLDGFGFVVPRAEGRAITAASWVSQKFAHRAPEGAALIRCFIGGAKNEELALADEEELSATARRELREIMGIEAEPQVTRVYRWRKAMPQYTTGHAERVKAIRRLTEARPGLFLTGSAYEGIGISDCVRQGGETAGRVVRFLAEKDSP